MDVRCARIHAGADGGMRQAPRAGPEPSTGAIGWPVQAGSLVGIASRSWLVHVLTAEPDEPEDWVFALMDEKPGKLLIAALSAHGVEIAAYPCDDAGQATGRELRTNPTRTTRP